MYKSLIIEVIIPALDEEKNIGDVIDAIDRNLIDRIIVVDNGSTDSTTRRARERGAHVVSESRKGYGSACLRGLAEAEGDVVVFIAGDGSDDPTETQRLIASLVEGNADIVIGSRTLGNAEPGSLTALQAFGNALTCTLMKFFWNVRYSDLGPFRAVTGKALERLSMEDKGLGWTVEMQVKAARLGMVVVELPVSYRKRKAGTSKISGNPKGTYAAGRAILGYVVKEKVRDIISARFGKRSKGY